MKKALFTIVSLCFVAAMTNAQNEGPQYAYEAEKLVNSETASIEDMKKALVLFEKAEDERFGDAMMYYKKGYCLFALGEYSKAVVALSVSIDHMETDVTSDLGKEMFTRQGVIVDGFDKPVEKTIILVEEPCDVYGLRGECKRNLGDMLGAEKDLDHAISKCPERDGAFYLSRGIVRVSRGWNDTGCLDLSKAGEFGLEVAYEIIRQKCR